MSSKTEDECVTTFGIRGFPSKCVCGLDSTIFTSKTQTNPGRPFFRCPTKKKDHLFKWVEEAIFEEMEDALPKIGWIESEFFNAKAEAEAMKASFMELKADLMITKDELMRCKWLLKIVSGACCLIILLFIVFMFIKAKARGDVLSY